MIHLHLHSIELLILGLGSQSGKDERGNSGIPRPSCVCGHSESERATRRQQQAYPLWRLQGNDTDSVEKKAAVGSLALLPLSDSLFGLSLSRSVGRSTTLEGESIEFAL